MRKTILSLSFILAASVGFTHAQDVLKKHGFKKKPLTFCDGQYNEFFNNPEVVQIGTTLFNTKTNKIVKLLDESNPKTTYKAEFSSMNIDPHAEKYYSISPYAYCAGNPVRFIDPDGQDIAIKYTDKDGKDQTWVFNGTNGDKAPDNAFVKSFVSAYNYNLENGGGENMKEAATNSDLSIPLVQTNGPYEDTGFNFSKNEKNNSEYSISWDPTTGIKTDEGYSMSPATCLDHEFDHALSFITDPVAYRARAKVSDTQYDNKEDRRVETGSEARTAIANQEFPVGYVRTNHSGGSFITVPNSTSNGDRVTGVYRWLIKHAKQTGSNTIYQRTR